MGRQRALFEMDIMIVSSSGKPILFLPSLEASETSAASEEQALVELSFKCSTILNLSMVAADMDKLDSVVCEDKAVMFGKNSNFYFIGKCARHSEVVREKLNLAYDILVFYLTSKIHKLPVNAISKMIEQENVRGIIGGHDMSAVEAVLGVRHRPRMGKILREAGE